jgi:hypothetical protein
MEPQILEVGGFHNQHIQESSQRILEGGSWKKQRTIILIPCAATIPSKVYLSHLGLITPPNQPCHRMLCLGMEVGEAYSNAIASIMAHPDLSQWEFILTMESDNCPPGDGLIKLIQDMEKHPEYSCIGGLYWTKGYGGCPQLWGDPVDPIINYRPQVPRAGEIQEVCGVGMGFNLFRMSLFKDERLRKPWFKTSAGLEGVGTQDLYFWSDARKYGYRCAIDNNIMVGHYDYEGKFGPADTMW